METYTKGIMKMESHLVLGNIIGKIKVISKDILKMVFEPGKVYGKEEQEIAINIKDNIKMIKSGDMVYLLGPMETYLKEITLETLETVTDKCNG